MQRSHAVLVGLIVLAGSRGAAAADSYEPNDAHATAVPIVTGVPVRSYVSTPNDVDYFMFTLTGTQHVRADLTIPAGQTYSLSLLEAGNPTPRLVTTSPSGGIGLPRRLDWTLSAGTYWLRVEAGCCAVISYNASQPYVLTLTAPQLGDSYEPNETAATASPIASGSPRTALVATPNDVDYYSFSLASTQHVRVDLTIPAGRTYSLALLEVGVIEPRILTASPSGGLGLPRRLDWTLPAGTYWIRVEAGCCALLSHDTTHPYVLTLTAPQLGDTFEPNETAATAQPLASADPRVSLVATQNDVDYYTFALGSRQPVRLDLAVPPNRTYGLVLFEAGPTGPRVVTGSPPGGAGLPRRIDWTLPPGTFWVKVSADCCAPLGYDATQPYTLLLTAADVVDPADPPGPPSTETYHAFLAEGVTSPFFDTRIALLNPRSSAAEVTMRFARVGAPPVLHQFSLAGRTRATILPKDIAGLERAEFSTEISATAPVVVDRTVSWDVSGYGAHAETASTAASSVWYLAEGATHSGFSLFYLLQNPAPDATTVRVRYLRATGSSLEKDYVLPARSRSNIWVNVEEFPGLGQVLAHAEVSAVIRSLDDTPIVVERAMYRSTGARLFDAGHASLGVSAPAPRWFLAEGATGPYFDLFVLIANPSAVDAEVRITYLLASGARYSRTLTAPANARSGVWVDVEQFPGIAGYPLADVAVSTIVESTNGVPLVVERAMWWPGDSTAWHEAHNSAGSTATGTRWALAEGEVGGPGKRETYILIANTSTYQGQALVTLIFEDGSSATRTYDLLPQSRTNVPVHVDFPSTSDRRFGALVESVGTVPAQVVVERAMYSDAAGVRWAAGTNALATRLQ